IPIMCVSLSDAGYVRFPKKIIEPIHQLMLCDSTKESFAPESLAQLVPRELQVEQNRFRPRAINPEKTARRVMGAFMAALANRECENQKRGGVGQLSLARPCNAPTAAGGHSLLNRKAQAANPLTLSAN